MICYINRFHTVIMLYERLVEVTIRHDLRDRIRLLKNGRTYDQFLREIIGKFESDLKQPHNPSRIKKIKGDARK